MQKYLLRNKTLLILLALILFIPSVFAADLYLNNSGSCSDAYTRAQAQSSSTPWCTIENSFSKALSGDIIIGQGTFRDENIFNIDNYNYNSMVTLRASVMPILNISYNNVTNITTTTLLRNSSITILPYFAGVTFTNISNASNPNLYVSSTIITGSSTVGCDANITSIDSIPLYPYDTFAHLTQNNQQQIGTYWNGSVIYLRYIPGRTPTLDNVSCFKGESVSITNSSNITLDGITFRGGTKVISIDTNSKDIVINNSLISGGASVSATYVFNSTRVYIQNTYYGRVYPANFTWCSLKGCELDYQDFSVEAGADWCQDTYGCYFQNNTINGYFNGRMCIISSTQLNRGFSCYTGYNEFYNIWDDATEDESQTPNMTIEYNFCHDSFVCVSVAPGVCSTGFGSCNVQYNRMDCEKSTPYNWSSTMSPYCLKFQNQSNLGMINWTFKKNTIKSNSVCMNEILSTSGNDSSMFNMTFKDNIFVCGSTILARNGKSVNGVVWDYNVYNRTTAGRYFTKWNGESGDFNSLAQALASPFNPGNWDLHSRDMSPQFEADGWTPLSSGNLCDGTINASDGGTIGAIDCPSNPVVNNENFLTFGLNVILTFGSGFIWI